MTTTAPCSVPTIANYRLACFNRDVTRTRGNARVMFRAFSDSTRVRILCLLEAGELCVRDLVTILRVPQPTASRHLAYLRRARLVVRRHRGPWVFYRLAPVRSGFHRKLLECLRHCFNEVKEVKADLARAARRRKSGGCCPP